MKNKTIIPTDKLFYIALSQTLIKMRAKRKLSIQELAKMSRLSPKTIEKLELRNITIDEVPTQELLQRVTEFEKLLEKSMQDGFNIKHVITLAKVYGKKVKISFY